MSAEEASAVFSDMAAVANAFLAAQGWDYDDAGMHPIQAEIGERQWQTILMLAPHIPNPERSRLFGLWPIKRVESPDYFAIIPKEMGTSI